MTPPPSRTSSVDFSSRNRESNQMKINSIAAFSTPVLPGSVPRRLFVASAATGLADWLFYQHRIGVSLALFLLVLAGLSLLTNPSWIRRGEAAVAVPILIAGVAPIFEAFNALSALFGVLALAVAVSSLTNPFIANLRDRFDAARTLLLTGPFRLALDVVRSRIWSISPSLLTVWVVPLLLGGIFLGLFASANPLIEHALTAFDPQGAASQISFARLLFWSVALMAIWPFIALRWDRKPPKAAADPTPPEAMQVVPAAVDPFAPVLFGPPAILRSLLLFNLLFAVQTILDLVY